MRDNKVAKRLSTEDADAVFAEFCDSDANPDQSYELEKQKIVVGQLVNNLPNEIREIVLLYYREEMSSKQVATLLSIPETAVRKRLSRARESLKKEMLNKLGTAIYATAPAMTFTLMTLGNVTMSAPASAATGSSAVGGLSKLGWLFSGAFLASSVAAIVVFFSTEIPLRMTKSEEKKKLLIKVRNQTIAWVLFSGLLLTGAYELTTGAIAPIIAFELFAIGLFFLSKRTQALIWDGMEERIRKNKWAACLGAGGLYLGLTMGFAGLIVGLINSGRLAF